MQGNGSAVEPNSQDVAGGPSALCGASNNMIQESEINNVRRDMSTIVVNINNVAAHGTGSTSGPQKHFAGLPTPPHGSKAPTTGSLGMRTLKRLFSAVGYVSQEGKLVEMDGTASDSDDDQAREHATTSNLCPGDGPRPNVDFIDLSCLDITAVLQCISSDNTGHRSATALISSIPDMYSRAMLFHKLGYPLYMPEPDLGLSKEYRKKGLRIGDVGLITPAGAFDFLFNTCLPPQHPINPQILPDGFMVLQPVDVSINKNFGAETFILSEHVKQTSESPITYQCSGTEGAVLALPEGSVRFEARNTSTFQKHAARHAESWYEYATEYKGRTALNGSLYLVTGCTKSENWGIAAFYTGETNGNSLQFICHEVDNLGHERPQYRWKKSGRIIARMGPSCKDIDIESNGELNQCTFIHGYKIMLREDLWERLTNAIPVPSSQGEPSAPSSSNPKKRRRIDEASEQGTVTTRTSGNRRRNEATGSSSRTSDMNMERVMVDGDFNIASPAHPSDFINKVLLQLDQNARVALTHDRQWCDTLPEHFSLYPSSLKVHELLENIAKSYFGVVDEFGGISLVKRNDVQQYSNFSTSQGGQSLMDSGLDYFEERCNEDASIDPNLEHNVDEFDGISRIVRSASQVNVERASNVQSSNCEGADMLTTVHGNWITSHIHQHHFLPLIPSPSSTANNSPDPLPDLIPPPPDFWKKAPTAMSGASEPPMLTTGTSYHHSIPSGEILRLRDRVSQLENECHAAKAAINGLPPNARPSPSPSFQASWEARTQARKRIYCSLNRTGNAVCAWHDSRRERRVYPPRSAPEGFLNCGCSYEEALFEESLSRHGVGSLHPSEAMPMDPSLRNPLLKLLQERYGYKDGDFDLDPISGTWMERQSPEDWQRRAQGNSSFGS